MQRDRRQCPRRIRGLHVGSNRGEGCRSSGLTRVTFSGGKTQLHARVPRIASCQRLQEGECFSSVMRAFEQRGCGIEVRVEVAALCETVQQIERARGVVGVKASLRERHEVGVAKLLEGKLARKNELQQRAAVSVVVAQPQRVRHIREDIQRWSIVRVRAEAIEQGGKLRLSSGEKNVKTGELIDSTL